MTPQSNPAFISSLKSFSRTCALSVIAVGGLVLVGWTFDIVALKSILPGLATMKANTALGFILAGVSLWPLQPEQALRRTRRIAQTCAFIVALLGLLTLGEDLFGWDLGIDQLLFQDPQTTAETSKPGRMAPATALNFLMLGAALLLLDVETRRAHCPAEWLILVPLLSSTIALIGYTYGVQALYRVPVYSSMALHSALAFLVASLGLLWARPNRGLMVIISSDGVAGLTARRLLPAAFFIPLVLGYLRLMGQRAGLYDTEFGLTLMVSLSVIALAYVVWRTARLLDQTEVGRRLAEEEARLLHSITQVVSEATDFHSALEVTLRKVGEATGWTYGEAWVPKADGTCLECAPEWYGDTEGLEKFREGSREFTFLPGVGLPGRVWLSKEPAWVRDVTVNSNFLRGSIAREAGLGCAMGIPILAGNEVIAVMNFFAHAQRNEDQRLVKVVSSIAAQLGLVFRRKLAEDQERRNADHIRALREIDRAITSTLDLHAVLDLLLEKIDLLLPYSATSVRLWKAETGKLEPVACRNIDLQGWQTAGPRGVGLPRAVFETKQPVVTPNVQTDPRAAAPDFLRSQGLVSYLGIPLSVKDQVLGVLGFYTKEEHDFSSDEIELLTTLARQAAIAIHNSQMYQEMANLAADLGKSNKVKEEFLSVMSHELRTPLNVVMGYTAMMRDGMLGDINQKQEEALTKITSRSNEQLAVVNNILFATVLETQKIKVESQATVLGDLFNQLKQAYDVILDKPLTLSWNCHAPQEVLHTDAAKIRHILQNLIDNAIKFTSKGSVTVSASVKEEIGSRQQWVEFKVADTGIGIPQEHLPFIFERFRQVDSSETRLYGGVGLGLYIAKKFTELLGGEITVESELGKGSTCTVTIPYES